MIAAMVLGALCAVVSGAALLVVVSACVVAGQRSGECDPEDFGA